MSKTISYYQDEKNNLWKKENGDEFFFSRKELKWIKCQIVFILPEWEYRYKIEEGEAHMILDDYKKEGRLNTEEIPFRYFANDNDLVFAEDILGNEFIVLDDMSLKPVPKGTVDLYWGGVTELEARQMIKGILFEISHAYSYIDEDYSYHWIIYKDGSIYIRQNETEAYEPFETIVEKEASAKVKNEVTQILEKYKKEIDSIEPSFDTNAHNFRGMILGKHFSYMSLTNYQFIKEIAKDIKAKIEEIYPNAIKWDISIHNGYDTI